MEEVSWRNPVSLTCFHGQDKTVDNFQKDMTMEQQEWKEKWRSEFSNFIKSVHPSVNDRIELFIQSALLSQLERIEEKVVKVANEWWKIEMRDEIISVINQEKKI